MLPQVNAQLVAISSGGTTEDWDQPAGSGGAKWSGRSGAYVLEKIRTTLPEAMGGIVRVKDTSIIISSNLKDQNGDALDIGSGDVVTFVFMGVTHNRVVGDENGAFLPGIGVQEYVRIHFTNEPPEAALESA